MSRGFFVRSITSVCAATAAILASASADASGFMTARFGSDYGNPMTANAYAVYFNPAALGGLENTQLTLDAALAYRSLDYTRSQAALSPGTSQPPGDPVYRDANTGAARLTNVLAVPFFGAVSNLGTDWLAVGFASYVPFGGQSKWDKNDKYANSTVAPGAVDGPQRWDSIEGSTRSWYNTAALAITIPKTRLSLGVNASYVLSSISVTRARNANGEDDMRAANGALVEGRSFVDASGSQVGLGVGLYYEPLEDHTVRLGASYTSKPGFGQMRLQGTLRTQFGRSPEENAPLDVDFLQTLPDVFRVGGAWRVSDDTELRLDFEYVHWSVFQNQCLVLRGKDCNLLSNGAVDTTQSSTNDVLLGIPRQWKNAGAVRASASYWVTKETEVFGSFGVDSSAVPVQTIDPTFPDSLKLLGVIGARWRATKNFLLGASYNHVYFFPVDTKGKSILYKQQVPSRSPSEDGTYDTQIIFLDVNATVLF